MFIQWPLEMFIHHALSGSSHYYHSLLFSGGILSRGQQIMRANCEANYLHCESLAVATMEITLTGLSESGWLSSQEEFLQFETKKV